MSLTYSLSSPLFDSMNVCHASPSISFHRLIRGFLLPTGEKVLAENAFYIEVIFCRHFQMFLFYGYTFIVSYQQTFLLSVTGSAILCIAGLLLKVKMADILTFKTDVPRDSDVVRYFWWTNLVFGIQFILLRSFSCPRWLLHLVRRDLKVKRDVPVSWNPFNSILVNIPFKRATQNSELILTYISYLQKNYHCVLKYVCVFRPAFNP